MSFIEAILIFCEGKTNGTRMRGLTASVALRACYGLTVYGKNTASGTTLKTLRCF